MKVNPKTGTPVATKGVHHNYRKEFEKTFKQLTVKHNSWQVWQDFVTMAAISISNAIDKREEVYQKREDEYLGIVKKYSKDDLNLFPKILGYTTMALEVNPNQDFLGQLYMDLDFGRGWQGQFFTPWHVAKMMAKIQVGDDIYEKISEGGYISVADPCCGAGVMLLAFAKVCEEDYGVNYQQSVLFVGQDIDPIVAKMCYIQMSLLGLPGYVAIGDSLANPVIGSDLLPNYEADKLWFTPLYFLNNWWMFRRMANGDESIQYHPSRKNGKTILESYMFEDAVTNPEPKAVQKFSTSEKDISLAKQELSKLEQQKRAVRKFFKNGKEKLKDEIKSKDGKKS